MQQHGTFPRSRDDGIALVVLTMILAIIAGLGVLAVTVVG